MDRVRSSKVKDRLAEYKRAIDEIQALIESLPSGIDFDADSDDPSPADAFAHIGGLVWQVCNRVKGET